MNTRAQASRRRWRVRAAWPDWRFAAASQRLGRVGSPSVAPQFARAGRERRDRRLHGSRDTVERAVDAAFDELQQDRGHHQPVPARTARSAASTANGVLERPDPVPRVAAAICAAAVGRDRRRVRRDRAAAVGAVRERVRRRSATAQRRDRCGACAGRPPQARHRTRGAFACGPGMGDHAQRHRARVRGRSGARRCCASTASRTRSSIPANWARSAPRRAARRGPSASRIRDAQTRSSRSRRSTAAASATSGDYATAFSAGLLVPPHLRSGDRPLAASVPQRQRRRIQRAGCRCTVDRGIRARAAQRPAADRRMAGRRRAVRSEGRIGAGDGGIPGKLTARIGPRWALSVHLTLGSLFSRLAPLAVPASRRARRRGDASMPMRDG